MKIVLDPIIPSERIEAELQAEIVAWFRETLFNPLLDLFDPERNNDVSEWEPFPEALDSLHIPREVMPQIASGDRDALVAFLATRGIVGERQQVLPGELKPTQAMFSPAKVDRARAHEGGDRAVLVSRTMRVIDGHHQWYAALLDRPEVPIEAIVFDGNLLRLIQLMGEFPEVIRDNAVEYPELNAALFSGKVSYANGVFSGTFSAKISKSLKELGARFDKRDGTFRIAERRSVYSLRGAIAASRERSLSIKNGLLNNLGLIAENVAASKVIGLHLEVIARKMLLDLHKQFDAAVEEARAGLTTVEQLDAVTVGPDFTEGMVRDVRQNLTDSLDLAIKNFTEEETHTLRQLVEENWTLGGRVDRMEEIIRDRFGVSERKATFLAKQETSMLASEYARARAQEIGSLIYQWHARDDNKVRPDHQELDGKTFAWDDPPISNKDPERRRNPGMDYGCRCVARAVLNISARRVA